MVEIVLDTTAGIGFTIIMFVGGFFPPITMLLLFSAWLQRCPFQTRARLYKKTENEALIPRCDECPWLP